MAMQLPERPGTIHRRGARGRFYWLVRLPGAERRREIPLRPQGHQFATTDARLAEQIADEMWRDAALARPSGEFTGSIESLCGLYLAWAEGRYRRQDGTPSSQAEIARCAVARVLTVLPRMPAEDMTSARLEAVQQHMVGEGLSRTTVNRYTHSIKHLFKWAARKGYLSPHVYAGLIVVGGLRAGQMSVREPEPVTTVALEHVEAAIAHAPPIVADMIRLHSLTGMRPGELVGLTPAQVDRDGLLVDGVRVWLYRPTVHKTSYRGHHRAVVLGPRAQEVLAPYLLRAPESPCFQPCEVARQRAEMRQDGRCRRWDEADSPDARIRPPGNRYTTGTYRRAVEWAIRAARRALAASNAKTMPPKLAAAEAAKALPMWSPNQLRHNVATEAARTSLDVASTVLGHASVNTTLIYAERDARTAARWAAKHG